MFSTAGGGSIKVSDDAIANANRMFGESSAAAATDEQAQAVASASAGASGPALFSTAGGGSIKISDDAIANANRMFGESSSSVATDEQAQAVASASAGASGPALFSTAGGGSIKVSDDAIANANRMFGESSSAAATDEQAQAVASASAAASGPALFSTAGGGLIKVSDDAIANANRMFGESSAAAATDEQAQAVASASAGASGPALFSTAGGGSIKISDDAIANANRMFGESSSAAATDEQAQATPSVPTGASGPALFSMAGGGSIKISDDAIANANRMFGESSSAAATDEQAQAVASASAGASGPALFSTAGGGSIKISDDAIANANRMFGESSSSVATDEQAQATPSVPTGASGPALFSTAGGGSIKISDDAIANANRMFGESSSAAATDEQAQAVASATAGALGPALFSTAGGGSIKISDDAIANANRMFGESSSAAATDEQAQATPSVPTGASGPALFSMAGGGSIKISDDAIANANRMFGESSSAAATDEQAQATPSVPTGASGPALFSMAGGGSIKVSDDAIANANRMFGESSSVGGNG